MKKKLIPLLAMIVIAAICVGIVIVMNPAPEYEVDRQETPTVLSVNGEEVSAREYASLLVYSKAYLDSMYQAYGMDTSAWSDPETKDALFAQLKEQTKQQVVYIHTVIDEFNKLGLKLSKDELHAMQEQKTQFVEQQGGKKLFLIQIAALGLDEQMYDNLLLVNAYSNALNEYYFGENGKALPSQDESLAYYNENYLQAQHILISTVDDSGEPLTGAELQKKVDLANTVLQEVKSGKDFGELITKYNEDPGMESQKDGYIFTEGDMVEEFYNSAKSLKENEISELVKTDYGYHIIKRVPLDETRASEFTEQIASGIAGKDVSLESLMEEWMAAAKVETTEEFDKITLDNVFDYILTDEITDTTGAATDTATDAAADTATQEDAQKSAS